MERIYITGIAGLLGSNIVRELKDIYEITGVDCNEIDVYGVDYDKFDLLNEKVLRESIEKGGLILLSTRQQLLMLICARKIKNLRMK